MTALCALPGIGEAAAQAAVPLPPRGAGPDGGGRSAHDRRRILTAAVLADLWRGMDAAFDAELAEAKLSVQEFLKCRHPAWNLVGRVHFNLAENRKDEEAPFAFLATYTTRLSAAAKAQHLPLGKALQEYAGAKNRERLLSLLMPVQRAAEQCAWLKAMVDAGEIFHPLRWSPQQALQFLKDVPALEGAGVIVRMPASWRMNRPARPQVKARSAGKAPSQLGMDALLDFQMEVTLDGETLSTAEIKRLLAQTDGLAFIRGKWVEVDHERLSRTLEQFEAVERRAAAEGLSFGEAMRMLAGRRHRGRRGRAETDVDWGRVVAGPWLAETLAALRRPDGLAPSIPANRFRARCGPISTSGVQWLYLLTRLRLGACLADDMGLGKTIQVSVAAACAQARGRRKSRKPSLLVAPASLLANWAAEIARFAPSLKAVVVHPSATPAEKLKTASADTSRRCRPGHHELWLPRARAMASGTAWRLAVLDEAQAIKNPAARQTRTVKQLRADMRIALTGTPVENRLGDLWSIFDFINPGLLGSAKEFSTFAKSLADRPHHPYGPLRELVRPYILRRLKTDKSIIADLPDKTEVKTFCPLQPQTGGALPASGRGTGRQLERCRWNRAQRHRPGFSHAAEADLQPSIAMARRRRVG